MTKSALWLLLVLLAAVIAGLAWYRPDLLALGGGSGGASAHSVPSTAQAPRRIAVEAARVSVDTVIEDLESVGTLIPDEAVTVSPEIAGRVVRIRFREGQRVQVGDVLVELDADILRAELAKARSELALARANHQRAATLAGQGMVTLRARDEAVGALQAAEANVALTEARLHKATLRAPLSGIVGLRAISVGAYVAPGDRIADLADVDPLKLDFRVPELALAQVRPGQRVHVRVDALQGRVFEGEIYAIDPVLDVSGRALRVRARVPNPDGALSPGLFARVQVVIERRENALLVPESAVFARDGRQLVYRVVDGRAVRTEVALGKRRPGQVEIRKGLDRDAVVVTAGQQQVRDGSPLDVVATAGVD